jgi:hypothetical protein
MNRRWETPALAPPAASLLLVTLATLELQPTPAQAAVAVEPPAAEAAGNAQPRETVAAELAEATAPEPAPPAPAPDPAAEPQPEPATLSLVPDASPEPAGEGEQQEPEPEQLRILSEDELSEAGYVPGYRRYVSVGMSPYAPRVGALPGGITPGYGAPMPDSDWTFRWSGYMNVSLQASIDRRHRLADGQSRTVLHIPPTTIDEYASFVGTSTVPGNWIGMRFAYGTSLVNANVSIDTWNPTRPTTYYQLRSQYFINNAYLEFQPVRVGDFRLRFNVGYFSNSYGNLSQYGGGIYTSPIVGGPRGVGETTVAELDLSESLVAVVEHGIMGNRDGRVPDDVVPSSITGYVRPTWPAAWVHHAHAGLILKGEPEFRAQVHYLRNWSQDERVQQEVDNPGTRQMDEAHPRDGHINVYGADARLSSDTWGYLAAGTAMIFGKYAYPLKGLITYGGWDGEQLTDRWWGVDTGGTGKLWVFGINYGFSLGRIVSHPVEFTEGPDVEINTGLHLTHTWSDFEPYDGRWRHKYGADVMYTFMRYVGFGGRIDRVVPNSKDSGETFHVLAPRLQFKTDWNSHEKVSLMYAKWFYGFRTRNEGTGLWTSERMDDQLVALNFNMWW